MKEVQSQDIQASKLSLQDAQSTVIFHKGEVFTYFDEGLTRYVYVNADKTKVIKIEHTAYSKFNQLEFDIYNEANAEIKDQMAETTIHNNIIEQEFCLPIKLSDKKLTMSEVRFAKSCRKEVGWNKDGKLVCFDLDEFRKW